MYLRLDQTKANQDVDMDSKEDEEVLEIEGKWLNRNAYATTIILGIDDT